MNNNDVAWLFPGQGSQVTGMALALMEDCDPVRQTFSEASDILGYDLPALIADDDATRLNQTQYTQPALLVASTAMVRWWRAHGGAEPGHVAGHSLGEYSALVAAGAIGFADAVALVALRGKVMAESAGEPGCMAAILGLEEDRLAELCAKASDDRTRVWPANLNCPGQVVVAGNGAAVARVVELAKAAGAKRAVTLNVSAPSHTPLMAEAAEAVAARLEKISIADPDRALWCNARATQVTDAAGVRQALVEQLTQPVRWSASVEAMAAAGVTKAVEMGPGKVLMGLARRIDRRIKVATGDTPAEMAVNIALIGGVA